MPDTPDWKKKAEDEHEREREDIEAGGKSEFALHILLLIVVVVVFGAMHIGRWMFMGGSLIPSISDIALVSMMLVSILVGGYFFGRRDKATSIREERLIRLEMKIDALLDKHERIESNFSDLKDEVREAYRNG